MRKVQLQWFDPRPVKLLYKHLLPEDHYKDPILEMQTYGIYMYLDVDLGKARYIGQAYSNKTLPLQDRIRWEIVKDGNGCAESAFYLKCQKYNVDRFQLQLKVAHLKDPQINGTSVGVDDKFMNAIERALIYERARSGDPLMNETGKKRFRLGPIEIINNGNYAPLPARISL